MGDIEMEAGQAVWALCGGWLHLLFLSKLNCRGPGLPRLSFKAAQENEAAQRRYLAGKTSHKKGVVT
jgi:hypothetical protein